MQIDESKGDVMWHDLVYKTGMTPDDGGHHIMLQTTVALIQRKMDKDDLTPIDFRIGTIEPFDMTISGQKVTGMMRQTDVVFRPGKSDKTFAEWLLGSILNKKPEGV